MFGMDKKYYYEEYQIIFYYTLTLMEKNYPPSCRVVDTGLFSPDFSAKNICCDPKNLEFYYLCIKKFKIM